MESPDDWRVPVRDFLADKDLVFGAQVAKAVGRSYASMSPSDWHRLAACVIAAGFKSTKISKGVSVWVRP
jgi:hypothetical protein